MARMSVPYFQIPNFIFEIGLNKNEIIVYAYILRCSNQGSSAVPKVETIGNKCGMSVRSVRYATSLLEVKGLIKKVKRDGKKGNLSNLYVLKQDLNGRDIYEDAGANLKMKLPYFKVPNKVFEIGLDKHEILVYLYLARCANNDSKAFPKNKTLAKKCGIKKRAVQYATKSLGNKGVLFKQERKIARDCNQSNVYILEHDLDNLEENKVSLEVGVQNMHLSHAGYAPNIKNYIYKESLMKKRSELNSSNNVNYYSSNNKKSHEKKDNNKSHAEIGNLKLDYEVDEEVDEDIPF